MSLAERTAALAERDQLASQGAQDSQWQEEVELLRLQLQQVQEELESQHQYQDDLRRTLSERDQALAKQARSLADLATARDALHSERDQWTSKASSGEEAQKALKAEHAKQLAQRDATLTERDNALAELSTSLKTVKAERDQWAQRARANETNLEARRAELETLKSRQEASLVQHKKELGDRDSKLAERDRKIADLNNRFKALKAEQERSQKRTRETESLLATAQKMLEGQAVYLEDLSRKEEQAELALERERQYEAELLHFLAHSRASASLKPELIPRIRALLQRQANPDRNHQPT